MLNLLTAPFVKSMQSLHYQAGQSLRADAEAAHDESRALSRRLSILSEEVPNMQAAPKRSQAWTR